MKIFYIYFKVTTHFVNFTLIKSISDNNHSVWIAGSDWNLPQTVLDGQVFLQ